MASIGNIRGSNGSGSAAKATVMSNRAIDNPTITVDGLANWPSNFIAVTGKPDLETKTIMSDTLQVFFGHEAGGSIVIDSFAPGYEDLGNQSGDIVILKPTTALADEIADLFARGHTDDGSVKTIEGDGIVFSTSATEPAPDPDGRLTIWFEPL